MIKLIFVDTKTDPVERRVKEYVDRIRSFSPVSLKYVKSSRLKDKGKVLKEEAVKIASLIKGSDDVIVLDEKGESMDSDGFAAFLGGRLRGRGDVVFVVGGAWGVDDFLKRTHTLLSLSKMTFSHFTARLMLVEQIYRAFCILNNLPYVK